MTNVTEYAFGNVLGACQRRRDTLMVLERSDGKTRLVEVDLVNGTIPNRITFELDKYLDRYEGKPFLAGVDSRTGDVYVAWGHPYENGLLVRVDPSNRVCWLTENTG